MPEAPFFTEKTKQNKRKLKKKKKKVPEWKKKKLYKTNAFKQKTISSRRYAEKKCANIYSERRCSSAQVFQVMRLTFMGKAKALANVTVCVERNLL